MLKMIITFLRTPAVSNFALSQVQSRVMGMLQKGEIDDKTASYLLGGVAVGSKLPKRSVSDAGLDDADQDGNESTPMDDERELDNLLAKAKENKNESLMNSVFFFFLGHSFTN